MNFQQIYQRVQQQVGDTSASTLINIKNYINDAQQDFVSRKPFWSWTLSSTTFNTVAGTQQYALDTTAHKIINLRDESNDRFLNEMSRKQFQLAFPYVSTSTDRSKPYLWYPMGVDSSSNLLVNLYPVPDSVYTVRYDFYKRLTDLSADSDTPIIPARYHRALVYYACARYFEMNQDPMADYYNRMVENEVSKALEDQFDETDGIPAMLSEKSMYNSSKAYPDQYFLEL